MTEQEYHEKTGAICDAIGEPWIYNSKANGHAEFVDTSGTYDQPPRINMHRSECGGHRLNLWAEHPRDVEGKCHGERLSISVDINRPADRLARDIKRRLIEPYLEQYPEWMQKVNDVGCYDTRRTELIKELCKMTGERIPTNHNNKIVNRMLRCYNLPGSMYADIALSNDAQTLHVNARGVPADKAKAILRILYDKE